MFLAANPIGTDRLALDQEARAIQLELEQSGQREHFALVTRWATEPLDLLRELRKIKPTIVHFSGCGSEGLRFHGPDERVQIVSASALQELFGAVGASVKLVVLSACYSEQQADALLTDVDCVIGTAGSVNGEAARRFAIGFYGGLGEGESIDTACRQGCAAMDLEGLRNVDRPKLRVRTGCDPRQMILAR